MVNLWFYYNNIVTKGLSFFLSSLTSLCPTLCLLLLLLVTVYQCSDVVEVPSTNLELEIIDG